MNRDEVQGKARQAKGAVKRAAGKVADNPRLQESGDIDKASGRSQEAYGRTKRKVGEAVERVGRAIKK
jgi:uncharacterized protein YjbJ (UPF0337 family)